MFQLKSHIEITCFETKIIVCNLENAKDFTTYREYGIDNGCVEKMKYGW